jgi:predicted nucleotidyltransferase
MIFDLFVKSSEQRVLSLFAMNPDQQFYGRQISRKLKISLGATHGALSLLEKSGILIAQDIGKTKLYRLKAINPIMNAFKILNALLILEPLNQALKENSRRVILYGSCLTGTFTSESDLDLFVLSEQKEKAANIIDNFTRKTGLNIRPVIMRLSEWIKLENKDPEFFIEVNRGITLWEEPIDERGF